MISPVDAAVTRARELQARVILDVHVNPNAQDRELWVADPDGYTIVIASIDGEVVGTPRTAPQSQARRKFGNPSLSSELAASSFHVTEQRGHVADGTFDEAA